MEDYKNLYLTQKELADLFGISVRQVGKMVEAGTIVASDKTRGRAKLYNFEENIKRVYRDAMDKARGRNPAKTPDIDTKIKEKKLDILTNQATIEDYRVKEIKGKYHRSEDVLEVIEDQGAYIKGALVAMPSALAIDLTNIDNAEKIAKILRKWVNETLDGFKDYQYDPKKIRAKALKRNKLEEQEDE